ncbi:MAG: carboxypeptidase regulatory-like domain-containing protein, partial [Acidobacteriota bacterium]
MIAKTKARPTLCLLVVLTFCSVLVLGQGGSTGSLAGIVTDSSGGVMSGARVVVKSAETGLEFTATTSDGGTFVVPSLGTGTYSATLNVAGFKQFVIKDVKIDVGKVSSINIVLSVGEASETVTVVGVGGELLQTQSATVGQTITGRQIIEQPQASRDGLDLVTLLPGVQTTGRPRTSTINGLPKGAINITLDGVDVQDNLISSSDGFFTFIRPRIDAIEEVTVSTATPGADSSGDGAVQIKFVTRRGTNDYNGSLYWYHRNPVLNSNFYFNNLAQLPRARILLNQYGGRVGGPISLPKLFNGKDRAFFFVNYEEYR